MYLTDIKFLSGISKFFFNSKSDNLQVRVGVKWETVSAGDGICWGGQIKLKKKHLSKNWGKENH